jgi:MoaA/NifB/PqqE/SkfB family radical SAM enzyme
MPERRGSGHGQRYAFPAHLSLELTTRCNLRCVFCALNHDPRLTPGGDHYGDLSTAALHAMQPFFRTAETVSLNGHGESLLTSQALIEALRLASAADARTELTTNLATLSDAVARAFVTHRLRVLRVSIHAASPELYARVMRNGDLARTLANLRRMKELKHVSGARYPSIRFHFVGMKQNVHELPALVRLAAAAGARRIQVLSLAEYPLVAGESLDRHPALIRRWIPRAMLSAAARGILLEVPALYARHAVAPTLARRVFLHARAVTHSTPAPDAVPPSESPGPAPPSAKIRDCHDLWRLAIIEQNGNVRPCCVIERSMGNLHQTGFPAIWDGAEYTRLRGQFLETSVPECAACIIKGWTSRAQWWRRHYHLQHQAVLRSVPTDVAPPAATLHGLG